MRRPASVTVFGIMNIIFGALGIVASVYQVVLVSLAPTSDWWYLTDAIISLVMTTLLLIGGIGLLASHRFGWVVSLIWSLYGVFFGLLRLVLLAALGSGFIAGKLGATDSAVSGVFLLAAGSFIVLAMIYPIIQLVLLLSETVRSYFAGYSDRKTVVVEAVGEPWGDPERLGAKSPGSVAGELKTRPVTLPGREFAELVVIRGRNEMSTHQLTIVDHAGEPVSNTIGRDARCENIVRGDPLVSTRHCVIKQNAAGYLSITDLAATNRTWIERPPANQIVVDGEIILLDGDEIHIGNTVLKLRTAGSRGTRR